jgi:AraC-like DNA-binding protein
MNRGAHVLDPRTVANSWLRTLIATVEAQGVPAAQLLQGLPLDEQALSAANGRVGIDLVHRLWQRAVELTGDRLLGLKVPAYVKPNTFRVLGHATMSSASLHEALNLMLRYHRLVSEAGTFSSETHADGDITIVYTEQPLRTPMSPQQVEAIVGCMVAQAGWLAGRRVIPRELAFRHAAQGLAQAYHEFFGITPQFSADANLLRLVATDLATPLPQADADLCRLHCDLADRQLASLPEIGFVTAFAVQWLTARSSGAARINELAVAMGMSVRSLQRQLQQEGKSWTQVVDAARRETFSKLMQQGVTLDDAAQKLGYHDASSLSRAARRWFGKTPGQWRAGNGDA